MTGKRKLKKKIKLRFDEGQNCNISTILVAIIKLENLKNKRTCTYIILPHLSN